jgi:hypothetical protein
MALQAVLIVAIVAALVFAAAMATGNGPGGAKSVFAGRSGGGSLSATISMGAGARVSSTSALTFDVTRSVPDNDPVMWVTTKCHDASGAVVTKLDRPVVWGTSASLTGYAGTFYASGTWCEAYATLRPWQSRVLGDAYLRFDVGG